MKRLVIWLTYRVWSRKIRNKLGDAYANGTINCEQLRALASMFGPELRSHV